MPKLFDNYNEAMRFFNERLFINTLYAMPRTQYTVDDVVVNADAARKVCIALARYCTAEVLVPIDSLLASFSNYPGFVYALLEDVTYAAMLLESSPCRPSRFAPISNRGSVEFDKFTKDALSYAPALSKCATHDHLARLTVENVGSLVSLPVGSQTTDIRVGSKHKLVAHSMIRGNIQTGVKVAGSTVNAVAGLSRLRTFACNEDEFGPTILETSRKNSWGKMIPVIYHPVVVVRTSDVAGLGAGTLPRMDVSPMSAVVVHFEGIPDFRFTVSTGMLVDTDWNSSAYKLDNIFS